MTKCVICERRPANGMGFCSPCSNKLEAEHKRKDNGKPRFYLTYRGHVVALYPGGNGRLKPQLLRRSPDGLPKRNTVDLNVYCEGYSREVIKRFKACVLQSANA